MKLLFISDLHFAVKLPHACVSGDETSSDRLDDVAQTFRELIRFAKHERIQHVFILGDLFDVNSPDMATLKTVGGLLQELTEVAQIYMLPGNHDAHDRHGGQYTLDLFDALKLQRVRVMTKPGVAARFGDDLTLWSMPWRPDKDVAAIVDGFRFAGGQSNVLLLHQTIDGCRDGKRLLSSPLNASVFDRFDLALSGHIHRPQALGNVQYLGAPLQLRFGEEIVDRGFWTLDTETLELEQIVLDKTPLFITTTVSTGAKPFSRDRKTYNMLVAALAKRHVYVSFKIKGPRAEVEGISDLIDELEQACRKAHPGKHGQIRRWQKSKVITDDGASKRVRATIVSGGVATPEQLVEAFVGPALTLPEGVTASMLQRFGLEALDKGAS